ncbi:uncharacterized protein [Taeniopygia guttata]|uniref:uncharacterized protein n=1 Tax=Taeniopygia guttata TaxID=59729 RepID=UPI003BB92AB5
MKKCFRAPGRVIFLCNESGFCQRKEPARSEDRRLSPFKNGDLPGERLPARGIHSHSRSRLAGAPPRALTSGELRSPSAPPLRAARQPAGSAAAASPPRPQVRPPPRAPFRGQPGPRPARGWGGSAAAPRQRGGGKAPRERRRRGAAHGRARGPGQLPARPRAHLPQAADGARPAGNGRLAAAPAPSGATGVRSPRAPLPAVSSHRYRPAASARLLRRLWPGTNNYQCACGGVSIRTV